MPEVALVAHTGTKVRETYACYHHFLQLWLAHPGGFLLSTFCHVLYVPKKPRF